MSESKELIIYSKEGNILYENLGSLIYYEAIEEMKVISANNEEAVIEMDYNKVTIRVKADSDTDLIIRDFNRASRGFIPKIVGPYPNTHLSYQDIFISEIIDIKKMREEEDRILARIKERENLFYELSALPPMEFNKARSLQDWNAEHRNYKNTCTFVDAWARFMQENIKRRKLTFEVIEEAWHKAAKLYGHDFPRELAFKVLLTYWAYASEVGTPLPKGFL